MLQSAPSTCSKTPSQSWYDAGYVNVRRRYSNGLSFLANYTFAKALENAPDFRSPMFEAATPQNNDDLNAEKGPGCDIRHRFALSARLHLARLGTSNLIRSALTRDWRGSIEYQVQTGFPLTISVFGDTANAGTVVGENPIRANLTGRTSSAPAPTTPPPGSTPRPSRRRLPTPTATRAATPSTAPACRPWILGWCASSPSLRRRWSSRRILQRPQPHQPRHPQPLRQHLQLRQHH